MASLCSRFISRTPQSAVKSVFRANARTPSVNRCASSAPSPSPLPSRSTVSPLRRFYASRTNGELGCIQSLLPLHSAVAAARMTSCLSSTSRSCKALSQGTLCRTSPGL